MLPKRILGNTDIESSTLILGGHSVSALPDKTMPTTDQAIEILQFLYEKGLTHFDCTWKSEREQFGVLLDRAELKDRLLPIVWHGWHNRIERTSDEIVDSFHIMLKELGCRRAGMIVLNQWEHTDAHGIYYRDKTPNSPFADWFIEGFQKVKSEGLTEAVGWAVEPGPLGGDFLHDFHDRIDFIAAFWNYRDRRNQRLVDFARDHHLGVYAIAPFRRGNDSLFRMPGVHIKGMVRPWLKWVFKHPAVFGTAVSLPSLAEARMIAEAMEDDTPLTPGEEAYLRNMNLSIDTASE